MELEEIKHCLIIFDDVEALPPDQEKAVQKLMEEIACQGRHSHTSMLWASHSLTNYKQSRLLHSEIGFHCLFPTATSAMQLSYLLMKYDSMDRAQVAALRKLPSRWVIVKRTYPAMVIYDSGAYLLNP